jgi:phosphocarrier protein
MSKHDDASPAKATSNPHEYQAQVTLVNELGLHARAAGKLVALASGFDAEIWVQKGDKQVNAKSIMGILMLAASQGTPLIITSRGVAAKDACDALAQLIKEGFGEQS